MGRICRPDKLVVRDADLAPDFAGALGDGVDELLGRNSSFGRGLRDLLTVLVHADQKVDIIPL